MSSVPARVVLYGVGSPLVVEAEEACARAGMQIVAGIRNVEGPAHTSDAVRLLDADALPEALLDCGLVVAIFTPGHRKSAVDDALRRGFVRGAIVVHPASPVAASAGLSEGVFVNAGCVIGGAARLGRFALVNRSASIGHHCTIGDFVSIGPGAVLCGQVNVGAGAVIGAGAVVLPGVSIGGNAVVGAASLVRDDVPSRARAQGHPARVVQADIEGYGDVSV